MNEPLESGITSSSDYYPLLNQCQQLFSQQLTQLLQVLFSKLDDALLDFADKAETDSSRNLFFDGKTELFRQQGNMEKHFRDQLDKAQRLFRHGLPLRTQETEVLIKSQLRLLEKEQQEQQVAIQAILVKAQEQYIEQMFLLTQRLSVLRNGQAIDDATNPFSPRIVVEALVHTLDSAHFHHRVRMLFISGLDRHILSKLEETYKALNRLFIRAGVLAHLSYKPDPLTLKRPEPRKEAPLEDKEHEALFSNLRHLMSQRRSTITAEPQESAPMLNSKELISLIENLEQQEALQQGPNTKNDSLPAEAPATDILNKTALRQKIQEEQRKLHEAMGAHRGSPIDTDTIELVGIVFEFMLDDEHLPDRVKTLLSRLHTPFIKVAILDKEFFTQQSHPARQLLDSLVRAGERWIQSDDYSRGVFPKMQQVVHRISRELIKDLKLPALAELQRELQDFVRGQEKRISVSEQRAMEASRGRERLMKARKEALEIIEQKIAGRELPDATSRFLNEAWHDVLVFTLLREGRDSDAWRECCELIQDLLWSIEQKTHDLERQSVRNKLPQMENFIRKSLSLRGGYHTAEIDRLLARLRSDQMLALSSQSQGIPAPQADSDQQLTALDPEEQTFQQFAQYERLKKLQPGHWFEYYEQDNKLRAKLSWFAEDGGLFLFVDEQGRKIAEKTMVELAQDLEQGLWRELGPLAERPFIERTLRAIRERFET